ncbi:uncharacterized protein LOC134882599 isoform X2 [Eleginops maclovinus]|uniref:uncharacterized protein LOC134882599 isoform X2 n=1 Tax=Eleginops maclovinus TaxID=56733 RepID=UPI003080A3AF
MKAWQQEEEVTCPLLYPFSLWPRPSPAPNRRSGASHLCQRMMPVMHSRTMCHLTAVTIKVLPTMESSPKWSLTTRTGIDWRRILSPGQLSGPPNLMKVSRLTSTLRQLPGPGRSRPRPRISSPITWRRSACPTPPPSRTATAAIPEGRCRVMSAMEMDLKPAGCVTALGREARRAALTVMLQAKKGPEEGCVKCDSRGTKECETCKGKGQLLSYIQLKVEWTNNVEDHVVRQDSGLEADDLRSVSGKELFKNSQYLLYPLLGFPNPAISEASERMIRDHQSKYAQNSRILQQRQTVELIPITKVKYKWKSDSHKYYVYGNERKVDCDKYPATCCCVIQ